MLLGLASIIVFARVLRLWDIRNKGILTIAYAFTPVLWINSANAMDYMWSLSFVIFSLHFVIKKQPLIAGILLGLAIGSRLSTIALFIPFAYLVWSQNGKIRDVATHALSVGLTSIVLFSPLFFRYGLGFLTIYESEPSLVAVSGDIAGDFGLLTIVGIGVLSLASIKPLFNQVRRKDTITLFLLAGIIFVILVFVRTPYEGEYLIPIIPLGLLLLVRALRHRILVMALCALLILPAIVASSPRAPVGMGLIGKNIGWRNDRIELANRIIAAPVEDHSVVVVGTMLPVLAYLAPDLSSREGAKVMYDPNAPEKGVWDFEREIWYRYSSTPEELSQLRAEGFRTYRLQDQTITESEN